MSERPRLQRKNVAEAKTFAFEVKAVGDDGTFTAYAAVVGNVDKQGDRILPGAFTKTIAESAGMVPILDQHDTTVEVGMTTSMKEDGRGLLVTGRLYVDDDPRNELRAAREALVKMRHRQALGKPQPMSIGYRAIGPRFGKSGVRELPEVALGEVSFVTFPANPEAGVLRVKSDGDAVARATFHLEAALLALAGVETLTAPDSAGTAPEVAEDEPPLEEMSDADALTVSIVEMLRSVRAKTHQEATS